MERERERPVSIWEGKESRRSLQEIDEAGLHYQQLLMWDECCENAKDCCYFCGHMRKEVQMHVQIHICCKHACMHCHTCVLRSLPVTSKFNFRSLATNGMEPLPLGIHYYMLQLILQPTEFLCCSCPR